MSVKDSSSVLAISISGSQFQSRLAVDHEDLCPSMYAYWFLRNHPSKDLISRFN
jgi:hypothetical protein